MQNHCTVAIVYCSRYGHTKLVAQSVSDGLKSQDGTEVKIFTTDEATKELKTLDQVDGIIFGAPTFMGNMAWEMKKFFEDSVGRWVSRAWQNKPTGAFTNSSNFSGDKSNTLTGIFTAASQLGMIWVPPDTLVSEADSNEGPGPDTLNRVSASTGVMTCAFSLKAPISPSDGDLKTAEAYGSHFAQVVQQFVRGRLK